MKNYVSVAPVVALAVGSLLLSACDNKEVLDKLSGRIEAAKGQIAEAAQGLEDRIEKAKATLDGKIAAVSGKADKAAAAAASAATAAAANASEAGAVTAAVGKNREQIGQLAETADSLSALLEKNKAQIGAMADAAGKNRAQLDAVAGTVESLKAGLENVRAQVGSVGDSVMAGAEKAAAESGARMKQVDGALAAMAIRLNAAEKKAEQMAAAAAASAAEAAGLKRQLADLAKRVAEAEARLKAPAARN